MKGLTIFLVCCIASTSWALPATTNQSRGENTSELDEDPFSYFKDVFESFIEGFLGKDKVKVSDDVEVSRNSNTLNVGNTARSLDLEDRIENYLKTHDVTFTLPAAVGGELTVGARNLDGDELDFNFNFKRNSGNNVGEARKSKLKKILIPFLVIILLKAMTVVPLVLGVLVLKAFSALQLSAISFVISAGLAIFQLCKKIAENSAHAHFAAAHSVGGAGSGGAWDQAAPAAASRSDDDGQDLAYSAHVRM